MIWYRNPDFDINLLTDSVVVKYNNNTVAYIVHDERAQIRDVFVDQQYRQQGLGKFLLSIVEQKTGLIAAPMSPVSDLGQHLFKCKQG